MYTIEKEFYFSAAHALEGLSEDHQCSRLHGHNYIVKIRLGTHELDESGFVQDYGELYPIKEFIDKYLDHRFIANSPKQAIKYNVLKECFVLGADHDVFQSSAENLANYLYHRFKQDFPMITAVGISETPKTWAWYAPKQIR